jgi:uncharacterized protein YbjT (DUF2867 family)
VVDIEWILLLRPFGKNLHKLSIRQPWAKPHFKALEHALSGDTGSDRRRRVTMAFAGADGIFILPPSEFDPEPGYPEARVVIQVVATALTTARPNKVLCLSTIGADAPNDNLLTQRTLMEQTLGTLGLPVTFLRPGWFMENAVWDVATARDEGVLHSFLQPANRAIAMVSTKDIGALAAELLQQNWTGTRVIELEGPAHVSPNDLAQSFADALGHPVRVEIVPRATWEALFRAQGAKNPLPRMRMLDGFNEGWIAFRDKGRSTKRGARRLPRLSRSLPQRLEKMTRPETAAFDHSL